MWSPSPIQGPALSLVRYPSGQVEEVGNGAVRRVVVFEYGQRRFGVPVERTREVMRPGRIEPVPDLPAFVRGVSIVRGHTTPIVDVGELLGEPGSAPIERLLLLRTSGDREVGLLVGTVHGVRPVPQGDLPALLANAPRGVVQELARLDGRLLTVLRATALVPPDVWARARPEAET